MGFLKHEDVSLWLTPLTLKSIGLWSASNRGERYRRYAAMSYTLVVATYAFWVEGRDFYYSLGDFATSVYVGCNIMFLFMAMLKITTLFLSRRKFFYLVSYMQRNFWHSNYSEDEKIILAKWKRICNYFVCSFTFCIGFTNSLYAIRPLWTNIGRNDTDRTFPFNMYLKMDKWYLSPYYETIYITQIFTLYHVGSCYFSIDNFLCVSNMHIASQFNILQYRLENLHKARGNENSNEISNSDLSSLTKKSYNALKDCIRQHQSLIAFCDKLEELFSLISLAKVLSFSLIICFIGFQLLVADLPSSRRFPFIFFLAGIMCQLLMFTYSCDCLIQQSLDVAEAVYRGPWIHFPMDEHGKMLRKDMLIVILRSKQPCCLTAYNFFPICLETYTKILSTAMSYFTLLRGNSVEA